MAHKNEWENCLQTYSASAGFAGCIGLQAEHIANEIKEEIKR
jgi:hypothetical protein